MKRWMWPLVAFAVVGGCRNGSAPVPHAEVPPDPPSAVFYLGKSPGANVLTARGADNGILVREILRQALLIAAREELGLVTRDAWLGDAAPRDGSARPLDLRTQPGRPAKLVVLRGSPPSQKEVGAAELPVFPEAVDFKRLAVEAERLSRTSMVEILRKVRRGGTPRTWKADLAVPESVGKLLGEMGFLSQFDALRRLHALVAGRGESPAVLGALVRGYANLGVLTEFCWHPAHKVFEARAILYAQRWLAREPASLPALWHRAYALALAGLHKDALEDLEAAAKAWQAMPAKQRPPQPGWVGLLDAYLRYDIAKLAAGLDDAKCGSLAALLQYLAVEQAGNQRWALSTAGTTLDKLPECYRVYDSVCNFGGVSVQHLATLAPMAVLGRTLYKRVGGMPGLPESVRREAQGPASEEAGAAVLGDESGMAGEFKARAKLMAALGQARDDSGEPSWAALGRLIHEVSFVQVWQRANFERYSLCVSADDFLKTADPLIAGHPLRAFLDCFAWDVSKRREAITRAMGITPEGIEPHARNLFNDVDAAHHEHGMATQQMVQQNSDDVTRDLVAFCRLFYNQPEPLAHFGRILLRVSPHSPLARASLINAGAATAEQIAQWEKLAPRYPALAKSLAVRDEKEKRWDDAIRHCEAAIKVATEDQGLYQCLADAYYEKGDEDRWVRTLEAALRLPDYGLDHAAINKRIAWYYMNKKEWKRGLPYAEAAAQSYSGWGLACAAACHEALEDWEEAERYTRAEAERYRGSSLAWYYFCRRTGKGDLDAARKLAESYLGNPAEQVTREIQFTRATFSLLEKQPEKALAIYRDAFAAKADPFFGLWVAILADEKNDAATRDQALKRIRAEGPAYRRPDIQGPRTALIQLATWIQYNVARKRPGEIDPDAIEICRDGIATAVELSYFDIFLARYLQAHGKREEAIHCWKERMRWTDIQAYQRTLAGAALVDLGIGPESYRALLEKEKPSPKPAGKRAAKPKEAGERDLAVIRIKARIDGQDRLRVYHDRVQWEHVEWSWPIGVSINGAAWNPQQKPHFDFDQPLGGKMKEANLCMAVVRQTKGRCRASIETTADCVTVSFNDEPPGGDDYELVVSLRRLASASPRR